MPGHPDINVLRKGSKVDRHEPPEMNCRLHDKHPVVRTPCHRKIQVKESLLRQMQSWPRSPLSGTSAQVRCG